MKLNKICFPLLFLVSNQAFAIPELFTQTFDLSGIHYTLNFIADGTSQTAVTALTNSFAGTDPLTLLAPGSISQNDNLFDPTTTDPALGGGWSLFGIGFHDTVTNLDYSLFNILDTSPYLFNSDASVSGVTANFLTTTTATVDEPATPGLFALAALAAFGNRRRVRPQPV
jgi:MYXO-CTERM domain-containing protein